MTMRSMIESNYFSSFIVAIIVFNAAVLGAQTASALSQETLIWLTWADHACMAIFVIELLLKLVTYRTQFFRNGWNNFDFFIIAIALIPQAGSLSILRAFRIFRLLRLVTAIDSIRRVVSGLLMAIRGASSVALLLLVFFYIGAVISTTLFGPQFPEWFGSLGASMFTLFQIMTLESWSMGIVRPVMAAFPYAWCFFIPFIMVTTFMALNLFVGIIVDAIGTVRLSDSHDNNPATQTDIAVLREEVAALRKTLEQRH